VTLPDTPDRRKPIDRIPLLPLGRLHSPETCAYCGAGKAEGAELERTILGLTYAEALVCVNLADCLRRRLRRVA
jgi:hypothetical protein